MKFLLQALVGLLLPTAALAESYSAYHSKSDQEWMLILPAAVHGRAYLMAGSGLEIIDIRADGRLQEATEGGVVRDPGSEYPEPVETVIYQCNPSRLLTYQWKDGKRVYGPLLSYTIPRSAKKVVIRYVVHTPDGRSSSENILTSSDISELLAMQPRR